MNMERFPRELPISKQDFEGCGWQGALAAAGRQSYVQMHMELSKAARQALDESRAGHGKVLWLLSDACSMMLKPDNGSDPFAPFAVIDGRRSALPQDFSESDLDFFFEIVDEIDNPWLRARIADVLWTARRKTGAAMVLKALDSYKTIPLGHGTWSRDVQECWRRALKLAFLLRDKAEDRVRDMEAAILDSFKTAAIADGFHALWMADLLFDNGLGRDNGAEIADRLAVLADGFEATKDLHRARDYFERASKWYKALGNEPNHVAMTVRLAETWVKAAEERLASASPSHSVAASFYENAIQTYRTIPRRARSLHRVDERMEQLRSLMSDSGERSLDEMGQITTGPIDISNMVHQARNGVSGKDPIGALSAFVNLSHGVKAGVLEAQAREALRRAPLQAMLSATHLSSDGRVIARNSGASSTEEPSVRPGSALWAQMIQIYMITMSLQVQGHILPGQDVLQLEHRLSQNDFIQIALHASIVPPGRERLWGAALRAGFEGDFGTAVHLLSPQIENMVRFHLKNAGVKTTNLDLMGIENEIGLSGLMELPEVEQIFGKDLTFEFKVLFCDASGPNLRNEVAHGLLDDSVFRSAVAVYAWWLALKLAFNSFWNRARKSLPEGGAPSEDAVADLQ